MPEEKPATSRRWKAGALRAARAAAFLTVATGINGTLAAYLPSYEPFYVYLISVVVVAWLSGLLLGVTMAMAAVICYDWYFAPLTAGPSASTVVPLTIAIAAAVVTQLARRPVMRMKLPEPAPAPQLLTGDVTYATPVEVVDARIADLEDRLATARSAGDTESRLRAEAAQQARAREAALERELETMRVAAADQSSRVASLRRDIEVAKQRNLELDGKLTALQQELEVAYRKVDEERGRTQQGSQLSAELAATRQAVLDEKARADREAHLRAQLEQAARETLQRTADVAASHQRGEQQAQAALRVAEERLAVLEREREASASRADALQQELERVRATLDEQSSRAAALSLVDERAASLETERAAFASRAELLQQELERVRVILEDETGRADREAELREQVETASQEELQRSIAELTARHETALAQLNEQLAVDRAKYEADLDAARAEMRAVEARLAELPQIASERDELRAVAARTAEQHENAQREARTLRHSLTELEGALTELTQRYETAIMDVRDRQLIDGERKDLQRANERLSREIEALRQEVGEQRAANERLRAEHDAKLESVVTGITNDYEQSIGDAIVERETARAEVRSLTARVSELDGSVRELTQRLQTISAELETSRRDLEAARAAEQEQRAANDTLRTEYDAKLQSIVTGITNDYEQTIGQATVDRESARAEVRSLSARAAELEESLRAARTAEQEARAATEQLRGEYDVKLETVVDRLTADYERSVTQAVLERETLRSEVQAMTGRLTEESTTAQRLNEAVAAMEERLAEEATRRAAAEAERDDVRDQLAQLRRDLESARNETAEVRATAERAASEFDAKLQSIVNGLTTDYEQAIGEATVEKEMAKAEVRSLTGKLQDFQRKLGRFETMHAEIEAREKAAREALDAQWGEKLQKIVSGLASDHEADLGDAMVEKEAAKAEARSLSQKLAALQQRLQEEREQFRRVTDRWQTERAELLQRAASTAPPQVTGDSIPVVLVVHSDAGVRAMAKHALEQSGYAVLTASDGLEGLRVAGAQKPDVVLAEAVMPKMNGRELVQLLKSRTETAGMKIVLMSGANVGPFENASDFHADDFLQNPNDFGVMRATLANVLARPR